MCQDDNAPVEVPLRVTSEADGCYLVTSPVLPELQSRGTTPQEAVEKAQSDLTEILNRYEAEGKALPPQFR
jgi:predicted RNase H-like HicB family nuclease